MYSTIDKHNNEIYIVRLAMISNIVSVSSSYFPIDKHNIEIYNIRSAILSIIIAFVIRVIGYYSMYILVVPCVFFVL